MVRHLGPIAVVAWLSAVPVFSAGPTYELDTSFAVTVDGEAVEGAKVFRGGHGGKLLLVVPSESKRFLADAQAGTVFALREEDVVVATDGATAKVREHFAWSVPLSRDRTSSRFLLGSSEVVIQQVEPKPAAGKGEAAAPAAPSPAAAKPAPTRDQQAPGTTEGGAPGKEAVPEPQTDSARKSGSRPAGGASNGTVERKPARECISLQTRPVNTVPECSRFVFIRNTCDVPVVARLQRTEHVMTGTLPQQFTETVLAGTEIALGCSWWSGAMAPADHQIVGASYLP
ncbi:MAG TPA: hypothetical protein VGS03_18770 [Candidatus Polarisedimenticolia bacterium]|jgi:hypothetical protein|nr:hypothetical protein [Candidatus Polarisedimenticolia bacterium]